MAVTLVIQHDVWKGAWKEARADIKRAVSATLKYHKHKAADIAVVLMDDTSITPLNSNYRGKPKPTNVLSFPSGEEDGGGDILLAYETICREASEQKKSLAEHAVHLVVHGTLHLLGLDHEVEEEAEAMEAEEIAILATLGVANPYVLR